jgi:hypothetical protein
MDYYELLTDNELRILQQGVHHMLFEHVGIPGSQEILRDLDKEISIRKELQELDDSNDTDREYAIPSDFYFCLITPITSYIERSTCDDGFEGHRKEFEIHLVPKALWTRCRLINCADPDVYFHDLDWDSIEDEGFGPAYPEEYESMHILISDYAKKKTISKMKKLGFTYKPELTEICEKEYK